MKKKVNQWLDQQLQILSQQIEKYSQILSEQKKRIESNKLQKEDLKELVEFKHFDQTLYCNQNQQIQQLLSQNETSFCQYFAVQFDRISTQYLCNQIEVDDLPKIKQSFAIPKIIPYEKCNNVGCSNIEKTMFCLDKSCLQSQNLKLECPLCLGQLEIHSNKETQNQHRSLFITGEKLWELQNKNIEELETICNEKAEKIQQNSQQLQLIIVDCQKANEQKLQQFRKFIINKEKEILQSLSKFKQQYTKEKFTIYRELLLQNDLSRIILKRFLIPLSQEKFQELWLKGLCLLQGDALCQEYGSYINPVGKCIQNLNDQMMDLQQRLNQKNQVIEKLQISTKSNQELFQKGLDPLRLELEASSNAILKSQSEQLQMISSTNELIKGQIASQSSEQKTVQNLAQQTIDLIKSQIASHSNEQKAIQNLVQSSNELMKKQNEQQSLDSKNISNQIQQNNQKIQDSISTQEVQSKKIQTFFESLNQQLAYLGNLNQSLNEQKKISSDIQQANNQIKIILDAQSNDLKSILRNNEPSMNYFSSTPNKPDSNRPPSQSQYQSVITQNQKKNQSFQQ